MKLEKTGGLATRLLEGWLPPPPLPPATPTPRPSPFSPLSATLHWQDGSSWLYFPQILTSKLGGHPEVVKD